MTIRLSDLEKEIIIEYYNSEWSASRISRFLKRDERTVCKFLTGIGYKNLKESSRFRRIRKYTIDLSKFDNEEFSDYWSGFIAADGCIYNGCGQRRLVINLAKRDYDHLCKFNIGYPVTKGSRDSCLIDIHSNKLCLYLENKYNITEKKSLTLKYPTNLKNNNHFIRGYFDGDGCFSLMQNKYLSANFVGTLSFLESLVKILPCKSTISKIKNTTICQLQLSRKPKEMLKFVHFYIMTQQYS